MEADMKVNAYLNFDGNCEAAFKFYEKHLGGKIEMVSTFEGSPAAGHMPEDWGKKPCTRDSRSAIRFSWRPTGLRADTNGQEASRFRLAWTRPRKRSASSRRSPIWERSECRWR